MQTNHLNLCTDPDCHNCHAGNLQNDQTLPNVIDDILVELRKFPQCVDDDDEERNNALLVSLEVIYLSYMSEEQVGQLEGLYCEAERQMEFWQTRRNWIGVIQGCIAEEQTDHADSETVGVLPV
jgi:hypothetical protein